MIKLGVLALQGDFYKHGEQFNRIGVSVSKVRVPGDLDSIDGIVLPGGESTTIGKLLHITGLFSPLSIRIREGFPVFATCAGLILLAKKIHGFEQTTLGALAVEVTRNAYGRQTESFEASFVSDFFGPPPIRGIFIRAPRITVKDPAVETLALYEDVPVLVQQRNILACSFHPELTDDLRIQEYFLSMVKKASR